MPHSPIPPDSPTSTLILTKACRNQTLSFRPRDKELSLKTFSFVCSSLFPVFGFRRPFRPQLPPPPPFLGSGHTCWVHLGLEAFALAVWLSGTSIWLTSSPLPGLCSNVSCLGDLLCPPKAEYACLTPTPFSPHFTCFLKTDNFVT